MSVVQIHTGTFSVSRSFAKSMVDDSLWRPAVRLLKSPIKAIDVFRSLLLGFDLFFYPLLATRWHLDYLIALVCYWSIVHPACCMLL